MNIAGLLKAGTLTAALLLFGGATGEPAQPLAPREGAGWELVWADEFDGTALDRSKWAPEESCWGGGNFERQCYTDRPDNIVVADGLLLLKTKKERFTGPALPPEIAENPNPEILQFYTSGKVRTRGLHAWR
jgi:beta-glucanase (GH16 family)